jgi:hypothetical protein
MSGFDPDGIIDRHDEQQLFHQLLAFQDDTRVLTITDGSGRGKSALLKLLEHTCTLRAPPVPACLVELDDPQHNDLYKVGLRLAQGLRNLGCFTDLLKLEDRAVEHLFGGATSSGSVTVEKVEGGEVAGNKYEIAGDAHFTAGAITPDMEARLRTRSVELFHEGVRELGREQPVVLLFDAYEYCGQDVRQWITELLRDHVFAPGEERRLLVVVAGQKVPTATIKLMVGERYDALVRARDALSPWEHEHVREFLEANHVKDYDDDDVDYLVKQLAKGRSIRWALQVVRDVNAEESAG